MSRASSDVFEDIEAQARYARWDAREARFYLIWPRLEAMARYIAEARSRLVYEAECKRQVESGQHDESPIEQP